MEGGCGVVGRGLCAVTAKVEISLRVFKIKFYIYEKLLLCYIFGVIFYININFFTKGDRLAAYKVQMRSVEG